MAIVTALRNRRVPESDTPPVATPVATPDPARRPSTRLLSAVLAGLALLAAGCSSGPGTREEFVDVLNRDGSLTAEEATCISEAVFDEYEADQQALGKISAAPDFEYLSTAEGVPGFKKFFEDTVRSCSTVGPTSG